jgi:hypothetical protein
VTGPRFQVIDGGEQTVAVLEPAAPAEIEPVLRASVEGDQPYSVEVTPYKVIVRRPGLPTNTVDLVGEGWGVPDLAHLAAAMFGQLPLVDHIAARLLRLSLATLVERGADEVVVRVLAEQLVAVDAVAAAGAMLVRCSRVGARKRRAHEIRRAVD